MACFLREVQEDRNGMELNDEEMGNTEEYATTTKKEVETLSLLMALPFIL